MAFHRPDSLFQGGSKRTRPSIIRVNLRIWSKIRVFLGWSKFVSVYVERDKKNFKKFDFCTCPPADLIDFSSLVACDSWFIENRSQTTEDPASPKGYAEADERRIIATENP